MSVLLLLFVLGIALVGVLTVFGTVKGLVSGETDLQHMDLLKVALALLIVLALLLPLAMLAWFAPALIVFRNLPAWEAMKLSFRACMRNLMPFLLYGLVALVLIVVACIPLLLGLLIVMPVLLASVYTSYRDIFP
jgi:uncharacterized membrane protein